MAKSAFARKFRQNGKRAGGRLQAYLADPENEKNIHDVRTSIRRLDSTFSMLPKKVRTRYRGRIEKYREFLRASSRARDCDVIAGRVSTLGDLDMADLQHKKKSELARATLLARSLKRLQPMRPVQDDRRIGKVARRLIGRIGKELPAVLSDSSKVKELHRLRKDFRKLRYILETVQAADRKKYMKKAARAAGRDLELKELQALLGLIHDSDVTIEYLHGRPEAGQILKKEIRSREQLYQKFVRHMK
jgi:CHAD domain-containing protein